jgi:hypothetical protein
VEHDHVSCALCGHQFSQRYIRERRSVTCVCGMRIDAGTMPRRRHHLRNVLSLLVAATLLFVAASVGRHFLG